MFANIMAFKLNDTNHNILQLPISEKIVTYFSYIAIYNKGVRQATKFETMHTKESSHFSSDTKCKRSVSRHDIYKWKIMKFPLYG